MNLLALETSSNACSLALSKKGEVFSQHEVRPQQHASVILQWLVDLLESAGITQSNLSAIAYSCGPGSFTGIRIAAAIGQGISFAYNTPLLAVPSLQVIAQGVYRKVGSPRVRIELDARMGQVYCGCYHLAEENIMLPYIADTIVPLNPSNPTGLNEADWVLVTDLNQANKSILKFSEVITDYYPHACDVLTLADHQIKKGGSFPLEDALPIYLRNEEAWKKITS